MNTVAVIYAICWGFRLWSLRARLLAYRFHGAEWWFDFRVAPEFYEREGKDLLRGLRRRLVAPYLVEAPLAAVAIWRYGVMWAMVLMAVFAIVGGMYAVATLKRYAQAGRQYAISDDKPTSAVVLSLKPRAPGDYTPEWLHWTLRIAIGLSVLLLAYALMEPGNRGDAGGMLMAPAIVFYIMVGLRLFKIGVVEWRIGQPPGVDPELLLRWQDEVRRQVLRVHDWVRGCAVIFLLGWAILCARPASWEWEWSARFFLQYPLMAAWVVMIIALMRSQRRFVALSKSVKPAGLRPAEPPTEGRFHLGGRLCFHAHKPTMLVRGPRGLALNASHRRARWWLAYAAGWVVLAVGITAGLRNQWW